MWICFALPQNERIEVKISLGYECHKSIIFICPAYETNEDLALTSVIASFYYVYCVIM